MMETLCNVAPDAPTGGRILIVDDDPIAAGMLGVSLSADGHAVTEVNSGEAALAKLNETSAAALPEVVFLDIEMGMGMGIDGYETCRRLHALDVAHDLLVIFISGHDGLEDRLRAYDAGGSDFIAKPFNPDEVLRKAAVAIHHRRRHETAATESRDSFATAMTALTSLGESGVTQTFGRRALGCHSLPALATITIDSMRAFGLDCHVQLRSPMTILTLTPQGMASPLEESVFEKVQAMGRIFSFGNRMVVNYDGASLLITNMPVADSDLCGRIRDHAAMIAEAAELAVGNINLRTEVIVRADELHRLAEATRAAVDELRNNYRHLQVASRHELETMTHTIEHMYTHLALTDQQEFAISDAVRGAVEHVLTLFESSSRLDESFAGIVEGLTKAGECTITQEDQAPPAVELW
jgi:CheY-like chemotaxis protein